MFLHDKKILVNLKEFQVEKRDISIHLTSLIFKLKYAISYMSYGILFALFSQDINATGFI